jgi:hypothetical protein
MSKILDFSMTYMRHTSHNNYVAGRKYAGGFSALILVMLLSCSTLAFSLTVMGAAYSYYESIATAEMRNQAERNEESCLDMATVMFAKDVFLSSTTIPVLGCDVNVEHIDGGRVEINVVANLGSLSVSGRRVLTVTDSSIMAE